MIEPNYCINITPIDTMIYCGFNSMKAFIITEENRLIKELPEELEIEILTGIIVVDKVALFPLIIREKNNPMRTYQTWFDYYNEIDQKDLLEISTQSTLNFIFFDEVNLLYHFALSCSLDLKFQILLQDLKQMAPWTEQDYNRALSKLLSHYSSTTKFWEEMEQMLYAPKNFKMTTV